MKGNTIITNCTHQDDCPHCKARQPPKQLPDIQQRQKREARKPNFTTTGFPKPERKYEPKRKAQVASKETIDFMKMLHDGHEHCHVNEKTVSQNAEWMGYVDKPNEIPELTLSNARFGFL